MTTILSYMFNNHVLKLYCSVSVLILVLCTVLLVDAGFRLRIGYCFRTLKFKMHIIEDDIREKQVAWIACSI